MTERAVLCCCFSVTGFERLTCKNATCPSNRRRRWRLQFKARPGTFRWAVSTATRNSTLQSSIERRNRLKQASMEFESCRSYVQQNFNNREGIKFTQRPRNNPWPRFVGTDWVPCIFWGKRVVDGKHLAQFCGKAGSPRPTFFPKQDVT